jgi:hypothetical protein
MGLLTVAPRRCSRFQEHHLFYRYPQSYSLSSRVADEGNSLITTKPRLFSITWTAVLGLWLAETPNLRFWA